MHSNTSLRVIVADGLWAVLLCIVTVYLLKCFKSQLEMKVHIPTEDQHPDFINILNTVMLELYYSTSLKLTK